MTRRNPPHGRKTDRMPTPDDLADAPELAILAGLDHTLDLAVRALVSTHPELADPERPYWLRRPSRMATVAETLVDQADAMKQALVAYQEAVQIQRRTKAPENPDDLRF